MKTKTFVLLLLSFLYMLSQLLLTQYPYLVRGILSELLFTWIPDAVRYDVALRAAPTRPGKVLTFTYARVSARLNVFSLRLMLQPNYCEPNLS